MNEVNKIIEMIEGVGGTVTEIAKLPDDSGFMLASFPLPKDHWLTAAPKNGYDTPPMPFRIGVGEKRTKFAEALKLAGRYAIRAATWNGKEMDFDPDALLQNLAVGMLGYWTEDGLSDDIWANPNPIPPLVE